jgi:hypothetical protein
MIPRSTLPGGAALEELHSLNGMGMLGMILPRSGHYVDPMNWRKGIQGIYGLETWPGSGGSDALLRNPINPGMGCTQGLGEVPQLTPGLHGMHGLMKFPGSGGSDALVRNPIHPSNAHAWIVGATVLGDKNKLADSLNTASGTTTSGTSTSNPVSDWTTLLSAIGIPTALAGLGCGCGCNGSGGCGDSDSYDSASASANAGMAGLAGLGDDSLSTDVNPDLTDVDWSLTGSMVGGIPNWAIYGGLALLVVAVAVPSPVSYGGKRKRNPTRKRRRRA